MTTLKGSIMTLHPKGLNLPTRYAGVAFVVRVCVREVDSAALHILRQGMFALKIFGAER